MSKKKKKKKLAKRLKFLSRIYMYIFLSISFLAGVAIFFIYAYADLQICNQTPEIFRTSPFIDLVIGN